MPGSEPLLIERRSGLRRKLIALTFDDGPSEWTEPILDVLARHEAHATFFVIGEAVAGREGVLRRIAAEGHDVGNHTYSHPRLTGESDATLRFEIERASAVIEDVLSAPPRFFRPPHLDHDARVDRVAAELGLSEIVLCSVYPADYDQSSADAIFEAVYTQAHAGAIVDLHDGRPRRDVASRPSRQPTVDAAARLIPALRADGYELVSVLELLAAVA